MERRGFAMMGRLKNDQAQLIYSFCLEEMVPDDPASSFALLMSELGQKQTCR